MNKHAQVKIGEYVIPLIGIPPSATTYECDVCKKVCEIEELELSLNGDKFLCIMCRGPENVHSL